VNHRLIFQHMLYKRLPKRDEETNKMQSVISEKQKNVYILFLLFLSLI
jgi:hypothetical protein